MCGITGFIGAGDQGDLARMLLALGHRGPDACGVHVDIERSIYLGHRRLSIIDIEGGAQPMWNKSGTIAVSFNGEIYNHLELRQELEVKGHKFVSDHSDTEVLVHGWKEWGEGLPLKLSGMFAFAILDKQRQQLFLARDRFGEKPLYWGQQNKNFFFSSELSAIAAHRHFNASFNQLTLMKYFAHGFIPAPNAVYKNTHKLPPGHWLSFGIKSNTIKTNAYWRFRILPTENPPSLEEAAEEIREKILCSVKKCQMSDVPVGVFLSGGLDSSFAAAAMCQQGKAEGVQSFALGFTEKSFDESYFADKMAKALGTNHHKITLDFDSINSLMGDLLCRLDEPLGDASILPMFLLCRFARSNAKVVLSGDGGDELFAGYDPFSALKIARFYQAIMPNFVHRRMISLAELLPKSNQNMSFDFKLRRALQGVSYAPELWNPIWLAPLSPSDIQSIFNSNVDTEELYSETLALWRESSEKGLVDKTLEFYSNFYLPDSILTKVDRASMLNGLEVRSIYLDNELVEFVNGLPAHYKINGKHRKIVLKKAAKGLVPKSIIRRPKKGFGIPLMSWLQDMKLTEDAASSFGMQEEEVAMRIRQQKIGNADHRLFLWSWSVLKEFGND